MSKLVSILSLGLLVHSTMCAPHERRASSSLHKVIVQMFEWDWDSIAQECTDFLGPTGYGYVQASPAQETVSGDEWWTDYQPVSYTLNSKRGGRDSYQKMIDMCHDAGVSVIADTIFNHMSGKDSGTGTGGSSFKKYDYPGIYDSDDFHHCGYGISNWDNKTEVWDCELSGLADLATETETVRSTLADYANDLLGLGVDGLRLDASKNINPNDIENILGRLDSKPYITQEVIYGDGQPVTPDLYTGNGDVQEFRYTYTLKSVFENGGIDSLNDLDNKGWISGSGANVFVTNHDTERGGDSLNYNSSNNAYVLATIFSLAHPYGTPTVLSSYEFSDYDEGAPNSGTGKCGKNGGAEGWLCQHRWIANSGMVGFRNNASDNDLTDWSSPSSNQIAFGRGSAGFVIINNQGSGWNNKFSTSLEAGSYCDIIHGNVTSNGTCSNAAYTVDSDGSFSATVSAYDALAIHAGAKGSASSTSVGGTFN